MPLIIGSERGVEILAAKLDETGIVNIPEKIGMLNAVRIAEKAFINSEVEQLILPETLIEIGEEAFFGCVNLKEVAFPTSLRKIDEGAFMHCDRLLNV